MDRPRIPAARTRPPAVLARLSTAIRRRFAIDPRALAAFRIAVGALLVVDLLARTRNLETFYTDAGVLPLRALDSSYSPVVSLHALSGEAWVQLLLFGVAGAFALAVLLGYRTRAATVGSLLLLLSLYARNPLVLNSGDTLLGWLLFWGCFLPLGRRWSIDALRVERSGDDAGSPVATVPTAAILLQVLLMYATNAVHKTRGDPWTNGEAVVQVFQADQLTFLLGEVLAEQHALLTLGTYVWMAVLLLSPLLVVLTGPRRAAFATIVASMHLGMALTVRIGLFPLIAVAALLLFYPPVVWDAATALAARTGVASALRRREARRQRHAPRAPLPNLPVRLLVDAPASRTALASAAKCGRVLFATVLPGLVLALVVLSSAEGVGYAAVPDPAAELLESTDVDQDWRMFAPEPVSTTKWLVAPGELENGSQIDALYGGEVDWDRPPNVDERYDTARERKYVSNMRYADNERHRSSFANYLCERWNRTHETDLENVTVYGLTDRAGPYDEEPDVAEFELIEYDCSGPFVQNE